MSALQPTASYDSTIPQFVIRHSYLVNPQTMGMTFDSAPFNCDSFMEAEFLNIKKQHGITTVIECGTYHGVTTKWLAQHFPLVITIEIHPAFYQTAKKNLKGLQNVQQFLGDSVEVLPKILRIPEVASSKILMFLDSHWYKNPLLGELSVIKNSGLKPFIVIHDFFVPGKSDINNPTGPFGFDLYPEQGITYTWNYVAHAIEEIYGDSYTKYFNKEVSENSARRGCLFVHPK